MIHRCDKKYVYTFSMKLEYDFLGRQLKKCFKNLMYSNMYDFGFYPYMRNSKTIRL